MRLEYFRLIDRIAALSLAERSIVAEASVPATSTIFEGHFPGLPLMPGVLLIETMAQASGWLVIAVTAFQSMPFLVQVKEAKLRTFVTPGTQLTVHATLVHEGSGFSVAKARIVADKQKVCDAELTFRVMAFENEEFRQAMLSTAREIEFPQGSPVDA